MHIKATTIGLNSLLSDAEIGNIVEFVDLSTVFCSNDLVKRYVDVKLEENNGQEGQRKLNKNIHQMDVLKIIRAEKWVVGRNESQTPSQHITDVMTHQYCYHYQWECPKLMIVSWPSLQS